MFGCYKYVLPTLFLLTIGTLVHGQKNNSVRFGISANSGFSKSNSTTGVYRFAYGFGTHSTFLIKNKLSGTIELEYNVRKEKFNDLKNYTYDENGSLKTQYFSLEKNYGLLDLKFLCNYTVFNLKNIDFIASSGIGLNTLFWYGTKLESASFETMTNGKTQLKITNPFSRPTISVAPGVKFPYDKNKVMTLKIEYILDRKFKNSTFTYPNFTTFRLKIQLLF